MKAYRAPIVSPPRETTITGVSDETIHALKEFVGLAARLMEALPTEPTSLRLVQEFVGTLQKPEELDEPFELVTEDGEITLR